MTNVRGIQVVDAELRHKQFINFEGLANVS
jgi:hypothetical protein